MARSAFSFPGSRLARPAVGRGAGRGDPRGDRGEEGPGPFADSPLVARPVWGPAPASGGSAHRAEGSRSAPVPVLMRALLLAWTRLRSHVDGRDGQVGRRMRLGGGFMDGAAHSVLFSKVRLSGRMARCAGAGRTLPCVYLQAPCPSPRFPSPFRNSPLMPKHCRASPPATASEFRAP